MRVKKGEAILVDARAAAEAAADLVTPDYYAQLAQIRLRVDATGRYERADTSTEVILDGTDVARVVECALDHPNRTMRAAVLAAIGNNPDAFRELLRFGLNAPEAFVEIRKVMAEELGKAAAGSPSRENASGRPLLPQMPLPAHLKHRVKE